MYICTPLEQCPTDPAEAFPHIGSDEAALLSTENGRGGVPSPSTKVQDLPNPSGRLGDYPARVGTGPYRVSHPEIHQVCNRIREAVLREMVVRKDAARYK